MPWKPFALLPLTLILLHAAGCGGGKTDEAVSAPILVSPSLGRISGADVRLYTLEGVEVGRAVPDAGGSVLIHPETSLSKGYIVKVFGKEGATYYDEGMGLDRPFPAGRILSAASPDGRREITVSALTTIAHSRAIRLAADAGSPLDALRIRIANQETAALYDDVLEDVIAPVVVIASPDDQPSPQSPAGRHASLLAAFASYVNDNHPACGALPECHPLLDTLRAMAEDFQDGSLDGRMEQTPLPGAYYMRTVDNVPQTAANLRDALTHRINRVRMQALPPIGRWLASGPEGLKGASLLSCTTPENPAPASAQLTMDGWGNWRVSGPWGNLLFSQQGSHIRWSDQSANADANFLMRHRTTYTTGSATPAPGNLSSPEKAAAGLVINLLFAPYHEEVRFNGNGTGHVRSGDRIWACTGFPALPDPTRVVREQRMLGWLPDGEYQCRIGNSAPSEQVHVDQGVLVHRDFRYDLRQLERPDEQDYGFSIPIPPQPMQRPIARDFSAALRLSRCLPTLARHTGQAIISAGMVKPCSSATSACTTAVPRSSRSSMRPAGRKAP